MGRALNALLALEGVPYRLMGDVWCWIGGIEIPYKEDLHPSTLIRNPRGNAKRENGLDELKADLKPPVPLGCGIKMYLKVRRVSDN